MRCAGNHRSAENPAFQRGGISAIRWRAIVANVPQDAPGVLNLHLGRAHFSPGHLPATVPPVSVPRIGISRSTHPGTSACVR